MFRPGRRVLDRALEPWERGEVGHLRGLPAGRVRVNEVIGVAQRGAIAAHDTQAPGRKLQAGGLPATVRHQDVR